MVLDVESSFSIGWRSALCVLSDVWMVFWRVETLDSVASGLWVLAGPVRVGLLGLAF